MSGAALVGSTLGSPEPGVGDEVSTGAWAGVVARDEVGAVGVGLGRPAPVRAPT
ncbi:MAG: hypothetical protein IRY92_09125 [Dactylosporangium sp.]|nr:hypothetical protein [Dactylosporangium sp.]